MYDTIIIGAGMSGLAAGIRLAHFDRRVCILERHSSVGGLNSFYRHRGRQFDVGLHAVTNFTPKGTRRGPLTRLLRQLRLTWEELGLTPQMGSAIRFPGIALQFSNDFALLQAQVREHFPSQIDGLRRLVARLCDYESVGGPESTASARAVVAEHVREPLLREMLFCPLMFYGSPCENDMDFGQFSIMFRSIFLEGLARPLAGVRLLLRKLVSRFRQLGGELRLRAPVRRIHTSDGKADGVVLDDGTELPARQVLSSAGWPETLELCEDQPPQPGSVGQVSFVESISVLDRQPKSLGHEDTIVFYNDNDQFHYRRPDQLCDLRSGVVCSPNNFAYDEPPGEGVMRITSLANYDQWARLSADDYRLAKLRWHDRMVQSAVRFVPDFRGAIVDDDMFTPITIRRYTGRVNGAVYGIPSKRFDGTTHLENLYICGTDQGLVGIVGTLLSGIGIANRYLLAN